MNASKKIIVVVESLNLGGSERQAIYLAKGLQSSNYEVSILALGISGNAANWIDSLGIPHKHMDLPLYTHAAHIIKSNKKELRKHFKIESPYALIPFTYWPNFYCNWVFARSRVKKCYWNQRDMGIRFGKFKGLSKIINKSSHLIGNSEACIKSLIDYYNIQEKPYSVIYNGLDSKFFSINYTVSKVGIKHAVMVANIQRNKDHETLIRSWQIIKNELGKECPVLHLAGEKRDTFDDLFNLVRKYELEDVVQFKGMVDNVAELIEQMDFAVFSSNAEGNPNGLLECIAGGLPAIVTNIPATREILGDKYHYLIAENKPDEFATKVISLIKDCSEMEQISIANRSKILTNYSMKAMIDSYIKLVES